MGRIKTARIKRAAEDLLDKYPDRFKSKFQDNKKLIMEVADIPSKKLRNSISGYLARLVKREEKKAS